MSCNNMSTSTPEPFTVGYIDDTPVVSDLPATVLVVIFTCVFIAGLLLFIVNERPAKTVMSKPI